MANWLGCVRIEESTRGIQESRGRFQKELKPGIHCLPWFFGHRLAGRISMKAQQLTVRAITKTKDDVFVTVVASVRFAVLDVADKNNAKKAFYAHNDTKSLIEAHSFDAIKTAVSSHTFVELFEKKNDLAVTVNKKLDQSISADFGFGNFKTLIIDIAPEEHDKRLISITRAAPKIASALTGANTKEVMEILLATGAWLHMGKQNESLAKSR